MLLREGAPKTVFALLASIAKGAQERKQGKRQMQKEFKQMHRCYSSCPTRNFEILSSDPTFVRQFLATRIDRIFQR
jgi:hypothetical protein